MPSIDYISTCLITTVLLVIAIKTLRPAMDDAHILALATTGAILLCVLANTFLTEGFLFTVHDQGANCCNGFQGKNVYFDYESDAERFRNCPVAQGGIKGNDNNYSTNGWGGDSVAPGSPGSVGMLGSARCKCDCPSCCKPAVEEYCASCRL